MESFCHNCGFWFPTSTAQDTHFDHTSHLPMWQPEDMAIDPSVRIMLETPWQFVMGSSPLSSPSTIKVNWKFTMNASPPLPPMENLQWLPEVIFTESPAPIAAEAPWNFTMDPSSSTSPIIAPWRLIMNPSPPAPTMETFPDFPNPFMGTHLLSPRVLHSPAPNMTLPVLPSIDNWAKHLLNTGCSKFGKGCFGNCVPGAEELQNWSRFPLAPGLEEPSKKRKATDNNDAPRKRPRTLQLHNNPSKRIIKNKSHANGKPNCWICSRMFLHSPAHIKTHEKECKWTCGGCQESFPMEWILTQHLQHGRPWCL